MGDGGRGRRVEGHHKHNTATDHHPPATTHQPPTTNQNTKPTNNHNHNNPTNRPQEGINDLIEGFADLTSPGTTVTFVLGAPAASKLPAKRGHCKFNYVVAPGGNPTLPSALLEAGVAAADTVVVGPGASGVAVTAKDSAAAVSEADARVLASLMQVQDAVIASGRGSAPHGESGFVGGSGGSGGSGGRWEGEIRIKHHHHQLHHHQQQQLHQQHH